MNIGDVVVLKSGGPKMTVKKVGLPNDFVVCQWFDGDNEKSEPFAAATLEAATDDSSSVRIARA